MIMSWKRNVKSVKLISDDEVNKISTVGESVRAPERVRLINEDK